MGLCFFHLTLAQLLGNLPEYAKKHRKSDGNDGIRRTALQMLQIRFLKITGNARESLRYFRQQADSVVILEEVPYRQGVMIPADNGTVPTVHYPECLI